MDTGQRPIESEETVYNVLKGQGRWKTGSILALLEGSD